MTTEPTGIVLFEDLPVGFPIPELSEILSDEVQKMFWTESWYDSYSSYWPSNMIVERPLLRIRKDISLYVTSFPLLADSINWYIESSIMPYPYTSVNLPSYVFKECISKPFENEVIDTLRNLGFKAGSVNEKNMWLSGEQPEQLNHIKNIDIPGEVDVLAYSKALNLVIIIECKVLGDPHNYSKMRNIINKIGELDSEGFHSKLNKKIQWFKNTTTFIATRDENFMGVILLDRKFPGMGLVNQHLVADIDFFVEFLIYNYYDTNIIPRLY